MTTTEKRPRQYAAEIAELPRTEWKAAVLKVPENLQELVREHLRGYLAHKRR